MFIWFAICAVITGGTLIPIRYFGFISLKLEFTQDEYQFVRAELAKTDGNMENALLNLLDYDIK